MKRGLIVLLVLVSLCLPAALPVGAQEEDPDLAALLAEYGSADEPGMVAYVNDGEDVYTAAVGLATVEENTPLQPDDAFRIGSVTKPFIAVVVLQLAEEGLLSLDDPAADYLPAEIADNIENAESATVRQLLNMTSGIYDYLQEDFYEAVIADPAYPWTAAETLTYAYGQPASFAPGEGYEYSNSNYNLLHLIIEGVTGEKLADVLAARIFTPLGMADTFLEDPDNLGVAIVNSYGDLEEDGGSDNFTFINEGNGLGDGGIISTAADMDLFLRGLFGGDLLSEDALAEMMNWVDDDEGGLYGLGLMDMSEDDLTIYGHTGATAGFLSLAVYLPEEDTTIILWANSYENGSVFDLAYEVLYWAVE